MDAKRGHFRDMRGVSPNIHLKVVVWRCTLKKYVHITITTISLSVTSADVTIMNTQQEMEGTALLCHEVHEIH